MRSARLLMVCAAVLVFAAIVSGCASSPTAVEIVNDPPVPAGMPVMYDFYTDT